MSDKEKFGKEYKDKYNNKYRTKRDGTGGEINDMRAQLIKMNPEIMPSKYDEPPEDVPVPGYYFEFLESKMQDIVEMLLLGYGTTRISEYYGISVTSFSYWRKRSVHKEYIEEVMESRADILVEEGLRYLEGGIGNESVADSMHRNNTAKYCMWLAGNLNKKKYGKNSIVTTIAETTSAPLMMSSEQFDEMMDRLESQNNVKKIDETFTDFEIVKE